MLGYFMAGAHGLLRVFPCFFAAQGLIFFAAQGFIFFAAQGCFFFAAQGFIFFAAQGFADFMAFGAQGFLAAHGFCAYAEPASPSASRPAQARREVE